MEMEMEMEMEDLHSCERTKDKSNKKNNNRYSGICSNFFISQSVLGLERLEIEINCVNRAYEKIRHEIRHSIKVTTP